MTTATTHRGDIGEATICQVRTAANPTGEWWVVQATDCQGSPVYYYQGPSQEQAEAAYARAADSVDIW